MSYETKNTNQNWTINRRVFPCTNFKVIMKNYQITKNQILQAHNAGFIHIKEWFPEVFKKKLEVGKWYKYNECLLNYVGKKNGIISAYGFFHGDWDGEECNCGTSFNEWKEATTQEVFEALSAEINKRGLNTKGIMFKDAIGREGKGTGKLVNHGVGISNSKDMWLYRNREFATIIPTISREEAEKRLGVKIE